MKKIMKKLLLGIVCFILSGMSIISANAEENTFLEMGIKPDSIKIGSEIPNGMKRIGYDIQQLEDGFLWKVETFEESEIVNKIQTYGTIKTKKAYKIGTFSDIGNTVYIKMRLDATFQYDGKASNCTKAVPQVMFCKKPFTVKGMYAQAKRSRATGFFPTYKNGKSYTTRVIKITCSSTGVIQ